MRRARSFIRQSPTFALVGIVLVVIPGPSVLFIDGRALAHGRSAALTGVAGNTTGATNPKVQVLFSAVRPQFVDARAGGATTQMLVLGLLLALIASVPDSVWGLVAGAARTWFVTSPARLRRVGGLGGAMVIVMGAGPALTGRRD